MKLDFVSFRWPFLTLGLLAVMAFAACTQPEPTDSETPPTEAPPIAASATMPAQEIPVSDFVGQYEAISKEWDLFHDDFDRWNAGLSSCHHNAMYLALNDFAVSFNSVTQQARDLSRGSTSGELADLLIASAEEEEAAFRHLRDRWRPNNVSLFENVEQQRTKSSQAQKSAEDRAIELREGFEDTADPEAVAEFQAAFEPIKADWETLHDDYESLQEDADTLGADAVLEGLESHVKGLEAITEAIDELPELEEAEETVEALKEAVAAEVEAFEAAIESAKSGGSRDDGEAAAESGESTPPEGSEQAATESGESTPPEGNEQAATESGESTPPEGNEQAATESEGDGEAAAESGGGAKLPDFEPLEASVEASAESVELADDNIDDLADPEAEKGLAELQVFDTEYERLLRTWAAFDQRYNEWRKNDAGCDRAEVAAELERYSLRISQLARDVRALPSAGYLLPIYTLLTEAAARDESAVRTLRYTWQPFTLDSFKAVHQERINTENLRREADIAVQELRSRS